MMDPRSRVSAIALVVLAAILSACGGSEPEEPQADPTGREAPEPEASPPQPQAPPVAQKFVLKVKGMTCEHCEASIQREVKFCVGVKKVTASHQDSKVVVDGVGMDEDEVRAAIRKLGFTVLVGVALSEEPAEPPAEPEKP